MVFFVARTIFILLLLGGGVPRRGEVVGKNNTYESSVYGISFSPTTPPFGHPSSQEEGNGDALVYSSNSRISASVPNRNT